MSRNWEKHNEERHSLGKKNRGKNYADYGVQKVLRNTWLAGTEI